MAGPKIASFSGPTPPGQLEAQQLAVDQLQLQQALQQLQTRGFSRAPIAAGGTQVPDFGGLGAALAARSTRSQIDDNQRKQADLQGKYQEALGRELKTYDSATGPRAVDLQGPPAEDGVRPTATQPADQRAYRPFLNSPFPEVRERARLADELYNKRAEKLIDRASFPSAAASPDMENWQPKTDYKAEDGAWWRMQEGQAPQLQAGVTQTSLPSGTVVNQFPSGKQSAVDTAPKISQTNVMGGENLVLKEEINALPKEYETAQKLAKGLRATETALQALGSGAQTGFGADWLQAARTAASSLTGLQFDASTPTGVLAKALAEATISELGGLGNQVSNADVAFMRTATGGTADDPKALERILAIRAAAFSKALNKHNQNIEGLAADPKLGASGDRVRDRWSVAKPTTSYRFTTPEALASFLAGTMDLPYEEALKLARDPKNAPPTETKPSDEDRARRRMEQLGLPYIPPGGR